MKPERFARLKQILIGAKDLPEDERPAYLERACTDDPGLLREAESLLGHGLAPDRMLDTGGVLPTRPPEPDVSVIGGSRRVGVSKSYLVTSDRHHLVYRLFDQAVSLDPGNQADFLDRHCADDPEVRRDVEGLIALKLQTDELPIGPIVGGQASMEASPLPTSIPVPDRIGRYEVLGELGAGGIGVVYLALDATLGRQVAIKVVPGVLAGQEEALRRFEQEARLLASLSHPNIATLHSLENVDTHVFLTMEVVEGQSLAQHLRDGPPSLDETLSIARQLALAIEAAHARAIVHRDLKPSNIMLTEDGTVKVLDFGLAKLAGGDEDVGPARQSEEPAPDAGKGEPPGARKGRKGEPRTRLAGTPGYMSPEQIRAESLDHRTDIWSYGCVLYECLTGIPAFGGRSPTSRVRASLTEDPDLTLLPPDLPGPLRDMLGLCLSKDTTTRLDAISSAREVVERLMEDRAADRAIQASGLAGASRRMRWLMAVIAVAAVGIVALLLLRPRVVPTDTGPRETQLTAAPWEVAIMSAAISPDGQTLVYNENRSALSPDDDRLILVQDIASGEITSVDIPDSLQTGIVVQWHPTDHRILAIMFDGREPWLWLLSPDGQVEKAFADVDATAFGGWRSLRNWRMSPDGEKLLLYKHSGDLWIVEERAEPRVLVHDRSMLWPAWSPTGETIAFTRRPISGSSQTTLETVDLHGNRNIVIERDDTRSSPSLTWTGGGMCWLRDGRLLYSRAVAGSDMTSAELWSVLIDPETGVRRGEPERLVGWDGFALTGPTASLAGDRLTFIRTRSQHEIYMADLSPAGGFADGPRRFTVDERGDQPGAWTRDAESYFFSSTRLGTWDVMRIRTGAATPEKFLAGPEHEELICLTPDGHHLLVKQSPSGEESAPVVATSVLAVPVSGSEPPRSVLPLGQNETIRCGAVPEAPCVLMRYVDGIITFHRLDSSWVPDLELGHAEVDPQTRLSGFDWALSPDGRELALLVRDTGLLRLLDLEAGVWRDVQTSRPRVMDFRYAADGQSLYAAGEFPSSIDRITFDGESERLWECPWWDWEVWEPRISPNGEQLTFGVTMVERNVWMLTEF